MGKLVLIFGPELRGPALGDPVYFAHPAHPIVATEQQQQQQP